MKTEVNPLVVYSTCIAIKLHFEKGSYDAFKFNFKGPQKKLGTFLKSKDRFAYEKIAKRYPDYKQLTEFILANMLEGNTWIRDMTDEVYMIWTAKMQRLTYQFNIDMEVLRDYAVNNRLTFDECLKYMAERNSIPIIDLYRRNMITLESITIIDSLVGFGANIQKKTFSDPLDLIMDTVYKIKQYKPFIASRINKSAAKNTIINLFTEMNK